MELTKKDFRYLEKKYDDLMTLQAKLLDWEEEDLIGDSFHLISRIERVRNDLYKIMKKTVKEVNIMKKMWYTKEELLKKYKGKFIDTYPLHYEHWNDKINQYETVYEVRGVSKKIRENYNVPKDCIIE